MEILDPVNDVKMKDLFEVVAWSDRHGTTFGWTIKCAGFIRKN